MQTESNFLVTRMHVANIIDANLCQGIAPKTNYQGRSIVNGEVSAKGSQPWIAALGAVLSGDNVEFVCGGSLVSSQHVLTSAHCLPALGDKAVVCNLNEIINIVFIHSSRSC